jgi:hypothetical protein
MADPKRSDYFFIVTTALVFIIVYPIAGLEKALAFSVTFGVFSAVAQAKWQMRTDSRFWVVLAVFAIIHISVIALIDIPELKFGLVSLPVALVDGFAMYAFLNWLEKDSSRLR